MIVKDNQPTLHHDARAAFVIPEGPFLIEDWLSTLKKAREVAETKEKKRGLFEVRTLTSTTVAIDTLRWPGIKQFLRLERRTTIDGNLTKSVSYAVTSLSREQVEPDTLLKLWRGRWDIENRLFWVREEDLSRIRTGTAYTTMSIFRNAEITLLRALKVPELTAASRENAIKLNVLLQRLNIVNKT